MYQSVRLSTVTVSNEIFMTFSKFLIRHLIDIIYSLICINLLSHYRV